MNSYYLFHFLGNYVPLLALVLNVAGWVMLVKSMHTQDLQMQKQHLVVAQLREHLSECVKAQIASHDQVDSLNERCAKLTARQQLVEKRGPDAQRIELATRMLKRGNGDVQTLHDLGLSNSEIKLLTRLHGVPTVAAVTEDNKPRTTIAAQGQALARLLQTPVAVD